MEQIDKVINADSWLAKKPTHSHTSPAMPPRHTSVHHYSHANNNFKVEQNSFKLDFRLVGCLNVLLSSLLSVSPIHSLTLYPFRSLTICYFLSATILGNGFHEKYITFDNSRWVFFIVYWLLMFRVLETALIVVNYEVSGVDPMFFSMCF